MSAERPPRSVTWALWVLGGWLVLFEVNVLAGLHLGPGAIFGRAAPLLAYTGAAVLCGLGALRHRGPQRVAWLLIALGILAWTAGDTYWTVVLLDQDSIPVPSPADLGYLAFPTLVLAGLVLLLRPALHGSSRLLLVDGLAAGLAVTAVVVGFVVGPVLADAEGVLVNLAYPISDLVLFGVAFGAVAVQGWRVGTTWALISAGMVAFTIADTSYLLTIADGSYAFPDPLDIGWQLSFLLLAIAPWQPPAPIVSVPRADTRAAVLPVIFAAIALGVLARAGFSTSPQAAVALAVGSLVAVGVRLLLTLRDSASALHGSRREALTDALTGLGNRRALIADLGAEIAQATLDRPAVLVLYDLDGFKHYNDSFGHPAGDVLLSRLGHRLAAGLPPRVRAYRIGGDEFCVLGQSRERSAEEICAAGAQALSDTGSGFAVTASYGMVVLPIDAEDSAHALRTADQRMYARKHSGRASARRQVADVLVAALAEREGDLGDHVRDVAVLAVAVAARLELDIEQRESIEQAAVLHDVGKVAIPDAILDKPGPLDATEWVFMRRHTVVGERIIGAAPALWGVAQIVRSSHERWDGSGYPDGLAGEAIPLGARIIAVCDAYDAMRARRAYSPAMSEAAALGELVRCGGTQFDRNVVDAFCAERRHRTAAPGAVLTAR